MGQKLLREKHRNIPRINLKLFLMLWVIGFLIFPMVSALDWDNIQNIKEAKGLAGYPNLEIKNSFGLGKTLWSGTLDYNSNNGCSNNCTAIQTITLHEPGVLIEDIIFKTLQEDGSWIEQPIRSYEIKVNGNRYILGAELSAGTYEVELTGEKKFSRTVDWIYVTQGEELKSWAVWGGFLSEFGANVYNFSVAGQGATSVHAVDVYNNTILLGDQSGNVYRYYLNGTYSDTITTSEVTVPYGVTTNGSEIWVSENVGDGVFKYNWAGTYQTVTSDLTASNDNLFGIEMNGSDFWASDNGDGIRRYSADWTHQELFDTSGETTNLRDIAYDDYGDEEYIWTILYTGGVGTQLVYKYYSNGTYSGYSFNPKLSSQTEAIGVNDTSFFIVTGTTVLVFEKISLGAITLNSPADNYETIPAEIEFNGSATITGTTIVNMSLWHNASGTFELNQTNNVTGTTNLTTFNATFGVGYYNWNIQVCDADGDCGFADNNRTLQISNLIVDLESHESTVQETQEQTFYVNVSTAPDTLSLLANLIYNGTSYPANVYEEYTTEYFINYTFETPAITGDSQSHNFIWEFVLATGSGTEYINSSTYSQTVTAMNTINITNLACSPGFFQAINYTFRDAGNFTSLTPDVKYNFEYGISNTSTKEIYGEHNNTAILRVCVNATNNNYRIGYGEIDYQEQGYVERRYYMFDGHNISNSTGETYELYDLVNGDSTSFIFEIKNTFLNPFTDKYISLLRWYPQNNTYITTEMAITDADGKTVMKVHTEDIDYRVAIYYKNGSLIKLADPVRMACLVAPCTYTLRITTDGVDYSEIYNVESSLTWDETNERFVYIWNDPSQNTDEMQLLVTKDLGFQAITICNTTGTGYTGVLTCSCVNQTGLLRAQAFRTASPLTAIADMFHTVRTGMSNTLGLFISFILALVMALIGIFSPIGAIIMMLIALLPAVIIGSITFPVMMGIGVLGGIIIHFMKKAP